MKKSRLIIDQSIVSHPSKQTKKSEQSYVNVIVIRVNSKVSLYHGKKNISNFQECGMIMKTVAFTINSTFIQVSQRRNFVINRLSPNIYVC